MDGAPRAEVALMGQGRLGRSLALLLPERGVSVVAWRRGELVPDADLHWILVPDGAVAEVAGLVPRGALVLHGSGALDVDVLRPHAPAGSLHLLQSFPGPDVALPALDGVPAALAGDAEAVQAARRLALRLGLVPVHVPGDRRLYHAAAVLAGNLGTVLFDQACQVLAAAGVPPHRCAEALGPLAIGSVRQAVRSHPLDALTGPVARRDAATLAAHAAALRQASLEDPLRVHRLLVEVAVGRLERAGGLPPEVAEALRAAVR